MAHETLCTMAKVTGRSSQKSGTPHSRMHCRIPNLCTQWLLSILSGQTHSLFGLSTPVPKTPLQTSFNNEHSRCTSSGTSPSSPFFTRFSLGGTVIFIPLQLGHQSLQFITTIGGMSALPNSNCHDQMSSQSQCHKGRFFPVVLCGF